MPGQQTSRHWLHSGLVAGDQLLLAMYVPGDRLTQWSAAVQVKSNNFIDWAPILVPGHVAHFEIPTPCTKHLK